MEEESLESVPVHTPFISALSSDPVRPPEPNEEADEGDFSTPEDTGTEYFINNLFTGDPEEGSFHNKYPEPEEDPRDHLQNDAAWRETLARLAETSPLKAEFIQHSAFLSRTGDFYTVGVHPTDSQARDTLQHPGLKEQAENILSELLDSPVTLRVEISDLIPEPIETEPYIEPEPEPEPEPAPQIKPPAPEARVEEQKPKEEEVEDEYYKDPFIEQALSIFKARILP